MLARAAVHMVPGFAISMHLHAQIPTVRILTSKVLLTSIFYILLNIEHLKIDHQSLISNLFPDNYIDSKLVHILLEFVCKDEINR